jgi:triacylglycerol esterase/lipase EstA (alpha/beta hydrolase family)
MTNPLDVQVGGGHYKTKAIQPIEYIHANNLNYSEGAIVKYITRWRDKNGFEDLEKIKHYVDLLISMEKKYNPEQQKKPLLKYGTK